MCSEYLFLILNKIIHYVLPFMIVERWGGTHALWELMGIGFYRPKTGEMGAWVKFDLWFYVTSAKKKAIFQVLKILTKLLLRKFMILC